MKAGAKYAVVVYLDDPARMSRRLVPVVLGYYRDAGKAHDAAVRADSRGAESRLVTAARARRVKWQSMAAYDTAMRKTMGLSGCSCKRR